MTFGVMGSGTSDDRYIIANSLRLPSATGTSLFFQRTPAVAGDRTKYTISMWVKRGKKSTSTTDYQRLTTNGGNNDESWRFEASQTSDGMVWYTGGGATLYYVYTATQFKDPDAWYHIVLAIDTTQALNTDRVHMYCNGQEVVYGVRNTLPQNTQTGWGSANLLRFGTSLGEHFDGHMAEIHYVDGQQLTPSSFAEINARTGAWAPKKYTGSYGTTGCYLNFKDTTSTTTLFYDQSGNGNNWTPSGATLTGTNTCVSNESPTSSSVNPNIASYGALSSFQRGTTASALRDGGMAVVNSSAAYGNFRMTPLFGGKWYWEVTSNSGTAIAGIIANDSTAQTSYTVTVTSGATWGFRLDISAGTFDYTTDGTNWTSIATGLTDARGYVVYLQSVSSSLAYLNHGQRALTYTIPSGYKLCSSGNFPTPIFTKAGTFFDTTYISTAASGTPVTITNRGGFTPSAAVILPQTQQPIIVDSLRGNSSDLKLSSANTATNDSQGVTSFNVDGLTLGSNTALNSGANTTIWQFRQGAPYGVDIVTYTGTGSNRTISHALGVTPACVIIKKYTSATTDRWPMWVTGMGGSDYVFFDQLSSSTTDSTIFTASPTSSSINLGTSTAVNASGDSYVAYVFSNVTNQINIGLFTGNLSTNGPLIFCGFRPRLVLLKTLGSSTAWYGHDQSQNPSTYYGYYNNPGQTIGKANFNYIIMTGTGFKVLTSSSAMNNNTDVAYIAFADIPFKYSTAF